MLRKLLMSYSLRKPRALMLGDIPRAVVTTAVSSALKPAQANSSVVPTQPVASMGRVMRGAPAPIDEEASAGMVIDMAQPARGVRRTIWTVPGPQVLSLLSGRPNAKVQSGSRAPPPTQEAGGRDGTRS